MMPDHALPPFPLGGAASGPDFGGEPAVPGHRGTILILGAGTMQIPAILAARREGLAVWVADARPDAPAIPWADGFLPVDLKDREGMARAALKLRENHGLHAVFTAATDFSATVAWVARELDLPGIPFEVAMNASSKSRMRRIFRENGIPSPRFAELPREGGSPRSDRDAIAGLSYPLVVKPVDNMGARGVRTIRWDAELDEALHEARRHARAGIIVEEFIEGPEYSIDSIVIGGKVHPCGIADRHIRFPPWFIEMGHTLPADLSDGDRNLLVDTFSRAVAALGIIDGVAKGDVFISARGPVIGEIAARLSGGYMSGWTFPWASGTDVTRLAVRQALGTSVEVPAPRHDFHVAERALVSIPGTVQSLTGDEMLQTMPGFRAWFPRASAGDPVRFPRNNVEKSGNVIFFGSTRGEASVQAEMAIARMCLRLVPCNPLTDRFLFLPETDEPAAFPGLEAALASGAFAGSARVDAMSRDLRVKDLLLFLCPDCLDSRDWAWRTLADTLDMIGRILPEFLFWEQGRDPAEMQAFLTALARGGLQGGVYLLESLWTPGGDAWFRSLHLPGGNHD